MDEFRRAVVVFVDPSSIVGEEGRRLWRQFLDDVRRARLDVFVPEASSGEWSWRRWRADELHNIDPEDWQSVAENWERYDFLIDTWRDPLHSFGDEPHAVILPATDAEISWHIQRLVALHSVRTVVVATDLKYLRYRNVVHYPNDRREFLRLLLAASASDLYRGEALSIPSPPPAPAMESKEVGAARSIPSRPKRRGAHGHIDAAVRFAG